MKAFNNQAGLRIKSFAKTGDDVTLKTEYTEEFKKVGSPRQIEIVPKLISHSANDLFASTVSHESNLKDF